MSDTASLSEVLDRLEDAVEREDEGEGEDVSVDRVVEALGQQSFASLLLVFSLVSASPASAIPGLTAIVAVIDLLLVVQMMAGRDDVWLPGFITRREMSTDKLRKGIGWLRPPVRFVERFLRPRLTFLLHRPWLWLPMLLVAALTLFMPFMELVPMSGSIASAVIALFAASILTRDGALLLVAAALLAALPVLLWNLGFGG